MEEGRSNGSDMYPKIKFHQNIEIIYRWRFKKLS